MTIEREALKLALAAFYQIFESTPPYRDDGTCVINDKSVELSNKAITLIKKALAPPEQAPTDELHSCPYAEEIHGNYEKVCDCDEERTRQCAQDI